MKLERLPRQAKLHLENGRTANVTWLGRGMFAECWTNGRTVYSIVGSRYGVMDYSRDILESVQTTNTLIPRVRFLGEMDEKRVYTMKLFQALKASHKKAWSQYILLLGVSYHAHKTLRSLNTRRIDSVEYNQCVVDYVLKKDKVLGNALQKLADEACNYDDYRFEFKRSNLKVNKRGQLRLVDVLYPVKAIRARWEQKRQR